MVSAFLLNALGHTHNRQSQRFDTSDILLLVPKYSCAISAATNGLNKVPVALLLPRGLNLAASEFSVLSQGRFFLPIDPTNPIDRIENILQDSSADVVVVDHTTRHLVSQLSSSSVVDLSEIEADPFVCAESSDLDDLISLQPDDLAYMIYTSGSTGQPKGVPVHWAALDNHNQWFIDEFELTPDDRCTQLMSSGFDVSLQDIFPVLRSGASLYPATKEILSDPFKFFQWVESNQLTVLSFPTALWHTLVPVLEEHPLPKSVRLVLIGGEQVNPQLVKQWFSNVDANAVRLVNMYGPTEVTIASTFCELSPTQPCAIGKPIRNIEAHLFDDDGNVVTQPDLVGEIVLSGAGVVDGYWNRPEQTADSFFKSDSSGQRCYRTGDLARYDELGRLLFVGRKDNQVKLRGFRIELDGITLAVCAHPRIKDAVVRKATSSTGRDYLVCFAVADCHCQSDVAELEKDLTDRLQGILPRYMIPKAFHFLSQFPVTVGGKVDTAKLLNALNQTGTIDHAEFDGTETERRIRSVWKEILGHHPDSMDATFEDSGGDSLAAVSFVLRLQQEFDLTGVGLATLAIRNTVRSLVAHVDELINRKIADLHELSITHLPPTGAAQDKPCLILFHPAGGGGYFYNELFDKQLRENYSIVIVDSPFLTSEFPTGPAPTVEQIAQYYYHGVAHHLEPGQQVVTAGFSFGGLLAWEFAQLLKREKFQVAKVINIDQPVPAEIQKCGLGRRLCSGLFFRIKYPFTMLQDVERLRGRGSWKPPRPKRETNRMIELSRLTQLEEFYLGIEQEYAPKADDLEMTLIRGEVFLAKFKLPDGYGWSKVTNALRIVRVFGSHSTLFHKRFIDKLRSAFIDALKQ